jgi:hypothetical protein
MLYLSGAKKKNKFPTIVVITQHILGILTNEINFKKNKIYCWHFDYTKCHLYGQIEIFQQKLAIQSILKLNNFTYACE